MTARLGSLPEIEAAVWRELEHATHDKHHGWRTTVLATVDGAGADARTVILREVDARQRQLLVFTDDRAGKVGQLLRHPRGTLVMWSPELSWQLRCKVFLSLEATGLAATSRWARIKLTPAAQDYLARLPPGAPLNAMPADADAIAPGPLGREYFAVVNANVAAIDWLELHPTGHRRAVFDSSGARWVQA